MNEYPNNNVIEIDDFVMNELEDTFMPYFLKSSYKSVIRNLEEHIECNPDPAETLDFAKEDYMYNNKVREALEVLGDWYGVEYES